MSTIEQLQELRAYGGPAQTRGLEDAVIERFAAIDPTLPAAVLAAVAEHARLREDFGSLLAGPEQALIAHVQQDFTNFYPPDNVNPYVALAARGPWIVTTHGAVIHDNGGYGMLGMGHLPARVLAAMERPYVMANVMTPSLAQARFSARMRREVGQRRADGCPFSSFICMNSGSEANTVAARIADRNTQLRAQAGRAPRARRYLSVEGSFHGRTERPAWASHNSQRTYRRHLYSYQTDDKLIAVPVGDTEALREAFAWAEEHDVFIELMLLEPVMGEGRPGVALTREYYDVARELTLAHGSLLLIDSIQAGMRTTGYLSLVDFPGFEDAAPPDMEAWSKALNAGQYPLSVLGLTQRAAELHAPGIYGNTMTTNPRGLEVAIAVLDELTPELRQNIVERGQQLVDGLKKIQAEVGGIIGVYGTGLLVSAELDNERVAVLGPEGLERWCRLHGLGVIHGGVNALRYTPHFGISEAEVELVLELTAQGMRELLAAAPQPRTAPAEQMSQPAK